MNVLEPDADLLYKQLLITDADEVDKPLSNLPKCRSVLPRPGFCLKTKTDKGEKVFVNVCKGDNLPAPKDITDEELLKLLESEDPSGFRIPMSLGEPHAELDKGGKGCTAYDVVINPGFYDSVNCREILMGFFLTVVLEGLEAKYNLSLDRQWVILKNRKFVGSLSEQNIRAQSKPWIMEMDSPVSTRPTVSDAHKPVQPTAPEPPYTIIQEPPEGHPDFLVAEIHLPKIKMSASLTLDVGEDRLLLETRSNVYRLDIYLPYRLCQDDVVAQFNRRTKILTITMPVQPQK
jgi:hypothetical protein